jgi:hypothetical protein
VARIATLGTSRKTLTLTDYPNFLPFWKRNQFVYSLAYGGSEHLYLLERIIGRAERVADLLIAQARENFADPSRVCYRDAANQDLAFAAVMQVYGISLHVIDELRFCEVVRRVSTSSQLFFETTLQYPPNLSVHVSAVFRTNSIPHIGGVYALVFAAAA